MRIARYNSAFLYATLLGAFFLERVAAGAASGHNIGIPPFLMIAMLAWFPALSLAGRLWLGAAVGFAADALGPAPFGTTMILAMLLAFITEFFRSVISDRDSYLAKGAVFVSLLAAAFVLSPVLRMLMLRVNNL